MQKQITSQSQKSTSTAPYQAKTSRQGLVQTKKGQKGPIQAKQRPVNKSEPEPRTIDPWRVNPHPELATYQQQMAASYASHQVAAPLQRQTDRGTSPKQTPQGSSRFQKIAMAMGEQHGVDTSPLKATHNSSFPETVQAEATIQGHQIDFAPNKDTEHNMKHEVAHYIDNVKHGTPQGDQVVNGQKVDTTREQVVDQMAGEALQGKESQGSEKLTKTEHNQAPVQRALAFDSKAKGYNRVIFNSKRPWKSGLAKEMPVLATEDRCHVISFEQIRLGVWEALTEFMYGKKARFSSFKQSIRELRDAVFPYGSKAGTHTSSGLKKTTSTLYNRIDTLLSKINNIWMEVADLFT